jgi:two-component system, NtrC family, nitrogen regulation sensor histidine kinase NtrY
MMKSGALLQYRKDPRVVISAPILVFAATTLIYYLLQRAKDLTPEALGSRLLLFVLWNINLIMILGLLFVLLRGLVNLMLDRQKGILGSRFRTKLVATYVLTSLVPIALLFFIATDLLRMSIDKWFDTPVRSLLENSAAIAEAAQFRASTEAENAAADVAERLSISGTAALDEALAHVRQFHNVELVGAYRDGVILRLQSDPKAPVHEVPEPPTRFFAELEQKGRAQKIDAGPSGKWIRHALKVPGSEEDLVAVAGVFLPAPLSRMIDENVMAHQGFQQLESQRVTLKASQTSLFLMVTLGILFGVLWTAIVVSRRITVPVQALAEGTRTLAAGSYDHRIGITATDEFGVLIDSFNSMASQLESQRAALTESNVELQDANRRLDDERAYLSTVLESVSTGIIAFDEHQKLLSVNLAALRILDIPEPPPFSAADRIFSGELRPLCDLISDDRHHDARSREITVTRRGEVRYLEASVARLGGGSGMVIALEDLTQLVRAQKLAAWSEAARRIAHEIKNPLTPIQLSAERIAKKFSKGDPDTATAVQEGCETIVSEVGQLKRMVDEFSRFARMPAIHLRETAIATVVEEVARLYRDVKPGVTVRAECDPELRALVDPQQIRRAFINLVDNAIEATDEGEIVVAAEKRARSILLRVTDPGRGIPEEDKDKLFLPYFSTKRGGTGLGLAIVARIAHDHEGRISVHDNRPKGTRFEIELPA